MYQKYFILVLCLFLLGGSLDAKTDQDDWAVSNTMSREGHETHVPVRQTDTIDIDEPQGGFYSGDGMSDDEDASGWGDDEDNEEGSAVVFQTDCLQRREVALANAMPGMHIPQCDLEGEYEKKQCHGSTGHCWCVDTDGKEIEGSQRRPGETLDCENDLPFETIIPSTPKPRKAPGAEPKPKEDTPSKEEDDIRNTINTVNGGESPPEIGNAPNFGGNVVEPEHQAGDNHPPETHLLISQPGILAGIIGGAVVGLLCAVLLVMFIVYRMRKKDEGSYALDEPKRSPSLHTYARATNREFYA